MNSNQRIVCFHLYNDFSGSPTILRTVIKGFLDRGADVELVTSRGGILDTLKDEHLVHHHYFYRFSNNKLVTLFRFIWAQLFIFCYAFKYLFKKDTVFYINTILPVGAAVAGWLMRKRVVYHCHENAWMKGRVYKELSRVMTWVASEIICVSEYQKRTLHSTRNAVVVPNSVSDKFISHLLPNAERAFNSKTVLMACSPKMYKGIREFLLVAKRLPQYKFTLILNIDEKRKNGFLTDNNLQPTENVTVLSSRNDMYNFYNKASIVLNLSHKDEFIETFGMTVAEAQCAGLPCIVPEIGGVKELVIEGIDGYHIDSADVTKIADTIDALLTNETTYCKMAEVALVSSKHYSETKMIDSIYNLTFGTNKDVS